MAEYITTIKKSDLAEFQIAAAYMKKGYKPSQKGYGPFTYEQRNYGLNCLHLDVKSAVVFEEIQPGYKKPDAPAPTAPSRYGGGRSRKSNVLAHYLKSATIDTGNRSRSGDNTAHVKIVNSAYNIRRVIYLEDLKSEETLKTRIAKLTGKNPAGPSFTAIFTKNVVELWGFIVEGIHFNCAEDKSKLPYAVLEQRGTQLVHVFEKYFVSAATTPNSAVADWLKTRPVDTTQFLTNMKQHFLANMQVSLTKKQKELRTLQEELWRSTKEIAEIKFVFNSVETSSNAHFIDLIDKMRSIPSFDHIDFIGSGFVVTTKDLWADIADSRVYIGVFEIRLSITDKFTVEYRNIASPTADRYDRHHPHGGCTGGHYGVIQQALTTLDYYTFILSVVELLQNVNPREKTLEGLIAAGWPEKKPAKTKLSRVENWVNLLTADSNIERPTNTNDDTDNSDSDDDEIDSDDIEDEDDSDDSES